MDMIKLHEVLAKKYQQRRIYKTTDSCPLLSPKS